MSGNIWRYKRQHCLVILQHLFTVVIKTLLLAVVDMMKLEKLEFGGIRGKSQSQQVQWLREEFMETYKKFSEKTYDCLDVSNVVSSLLTSKNHSKNKTKGWWFLKKKMFLCRSLRLISQSSRTRWKMLTGAWAQSFVVFLTMLMIWSTHSRWVIQ